jgi:glycerol uptake facilitator-like aquaporin
VTVEERSAPPRLSTALLAEGLGTAFLLASVVGSGIMAERLAEGNAAIALLANAIATGAALFALITAFGPISGAHFNPLVTALLALRGAFRPRDAAPYVAVQFVGAAAGVAAANLMFGGDAFERSTHVRAGSAELGSEVVATLGLLLVVALVGRRRPDVAPQCVAAYVVAAYWFTASTAFANPAVSAARALTDSFAGIRPADVPGFVVAEVCGLLLAWIVLRRLEPEK